MLISGVIYDQPINREQWVYVNYNGNILTRYLISDHGNVYDQKMSRYLNFHTDKDGYFRTDIYVGEKRKTIRIHRVELMSFFPINNHLEMQVNHKDGNKQNNSLFNLEWTTPIDNTRHAWDTGLNQCYGKNNGKSVYNDQDIHNICQLLDQGLTNAQICDVFGITDKKERITFNATISGIRLGKCHRSISTQYHFLPEMQVQQRYSLDFAHLVCNFLSDPNRQYTYKQIMDFLQIPNEERPAFRIYINDLLRGRTAKSVTEQYNLKKPLEDDNEFAYLYT